VAVTLVIVVLFGVLGVYFDDYLEQSFLDNNRSRLLHGFQRLAANLRDIEGRLDEATIFVERDEALHAAISLIDQYQDKQHYNAFLIDEEKKQIATELLTRVKLSFNNDIALYDRHGELIAGVVLTPEGYWLHYLSYQGGIRHLWRRSERAEAYREVAVRGHLRQPLEVDPRQLAARELSYHTLDNALALRSTRHVVDPTDATPIAYVQLTRLLGADYFEGLSRDLDMRITAHFVDTAEQLTPLLDEVALSRDLSVAQGDVEYIAMSGIHSREGEVQLVAQLNKSEVNQLLDTNRMRLLTFLLVAGFGVLLSMRVLIRRQLAWPLNRLMQQIHRISQRDYSTAQPVASGDELEVISRNINALAETVQEREASLHRSQQELEYLSNHDPLTELPNRRYLALSLERALHRAKQRESWLALLFLDLDEFKLVNDTLGHDVGDQLLREVSRRLSGHVRGSDMLARIGGDEFNILLDGVEGLEEVEHFAQRLIDLFAVPFTIGERTLYTTASIGIALYPQDGEEGVTLTKHADLAMYRAKANGRNHFSFYSDELSTGLSKRTEMTHALREAVATGNQFLLHFQPKIALDQGRLVAVEALLRWQSPIYGQVSPVEFIPLAEESGLILPIGEWVLEEACKAYKRLEREGLVLDHISINMSNVQLQHGDMVSTVEGVVLRTGIDAERVELEITESFIATDAEEALATLHRFRAMKIRLAVDDFGTGYSSMSYLQRLPITRIKIDKSFIDGLPDNQESVAITRAILALARALRLSVTAEGVERPAQLDFLIEEACDEVQGYLYARPMPFDDLLHFARDSRYRLQRKGS